MPAIGAVARERMRRAMACEHPDRVPFMCQMSIGHMLQQLDVSPAEFWFDGAVFADGLIRLRELYDFDGILISLHGHDPAWRTHVRAITRTPEGEEILWKDGGKTICPADDLPLQQASVSFADPATYVSGDLPSSLDYIPVTQGLRFRIDTSHRLSIFHNLAERTGGDFSIHGEVTSPFDYFLDLFGIQPALSLLINGKEKAHQVLSHFAALVGIMVGEIAATGVDAIKVSSPFAGSGFISPAHYREFVLPYERRLVESARAANVFIYLHTCGAVADRLDLMMASGANGIECLDPPPLGNMELKAAKEQLGARMFIKGNVDSVNTLLFGTKEEILADARSRLDTGKQGGAFIFSTACSIAPGVPPQHIHLLREAVEKWGRG